MVKQIANMYDCPYRFPKFGCKIIALKKATFICSECVCCCCYYEGQPLQSSPKTGKNCCSSNQCKTDRFPMKFAQKSFPQFGVFYLYTSFGKICLKNSSEISHFFCKCVLENPMKFNFFCNKTEALFTGNSILRQPLEHNQSFFPVRNVISRVIFCFFCLPLTS